MELLHKCRHRENTLLGTIGVLILCLTVALLANPASAQQSGVKISTPNLATVGSIEGRVFGITRGGDLKPARMPRVYLLYGGQREDLEETSAQAHYEAKSIDAAMARTKKELEVAEKRASEGADPQGTENLNCKRHLLDDDQALIDTAKWALDSKKAKQVLTTDGDEEGKFRIKGIPPGHYSLIVRGQAGANDAFWQSSIIIKPGAVIQVKLSNPGFSCFVE
jgi:hypothetical protein